VVLSPLPPWAPMIGVVPAGAWMRSSWPTASGGVEGHRGGIDGQRRGRSQAAAQRMAGEHHVAVAERDLGFLGQRDRLVVLPGVHAECLGGVGLDVAHLLGVGAGEGDDVLALVVLVDRGAEARVALERGRVDVDHVAVGVDQVVAFGLQAGPAGFGEVGLGLGAGDAIGAAEGVGVVGHLRQLQVDVLLRRGAGDLAAELAVAGLQRLVGRVRRCRQVDRVGDGRRNEIRAHLGLEAHRRVPARWNVP
jgi:hypothetical protein